MTVHIDADSILYRVLFATKDYPYQYQRRSVDHCIESMIEWLDPDYYSLILTGPRNFRYKIYPEYKGNRKDMVRPQYLYEVKNYMVKYWDAVLTDGHEADDQIAMDFRQGDVIVAVDKDFNQIEGARIFNWVKNEVKDVENPWYYFCEQMLIGDTADNIPGVPNPAKSHYKNAPNFTSASVIPWLDGKSPEQMKKVVEKLYKQVYGDDWYDHFDRNASLLWLLRGPGDTYYKHW